jgi:glycosyltransferase involved in cell wall biosynthesis
MIKIEQLYNQKRSVDRIDEPISKKSQERVCIIIPALNEEESIEKTLRAIPKEKLTHKEFLVQVIVADNGSTDRTAGIARKAGADVIFESKRGKGNAFRKAIQFVRADYVFMIDGDATYSPSYIPEMLNLLRFSDVVIGSRLNGNRQEKAMSKFHVFGNRVLSLMASIIYNKKISDVCTGLWGFRTELLKSLTLKATGFELEAELFSQIANNGFSIGELPICYAPRTTPAKLKAFSDGVKIAWTLVNRRFQIHNSETVEDIVVTEC